MDKYLIIKVSDAYQYLTEPQLDDLAVLLQRISNGRKRDGKSQQNHYLIINQDEPYAEQVKEIMREQGHWGSYPEGDILSSSG